MQSDAFATRLGNEWYARNRKALADHTRTDWPLWLLELYGIEPELVLELGCADGWRLERLRLRYGCDCLGIDASQDAIDAGRKKYPELDLQRFLAGEDTCRYSRTCDLVIASYLFHCLDRSSLFSVMAAVDAALVDGGYLLLADFAPDHACSTPWRDEQDVWTYKLPTLPDVFVSCGLYSKLAYITLDHNTMTLRPDVPTDRRGYVALLKKESQYELR